MSQSSYELITFQHPEYGPAVGVRIGGYVYELESMFQAAGLVQTRPYHTMLEVLTDWERASILIDRAANALHELPRSKSLKPLDAGSVQMLPPILFPGAIFCSGANYTDHLEEMSEVLGAKIPSPKGPGLSPWHFVKTARGSVVAEGESIALPAYSRKVDWEIELAAIVGRTAKNLHVETALDYIAGYSVANDLSARDHISRPNVDASSPFRFDWVSQKCFDGSCPLGPGIVPARFIADPQKLNLELRVNGEIKQSSNTSNMIYSVAEQLAFLSSRITLYPGDVILTGTPAGVGLASNTFLRPGDVVSAWIESVGTLTTSIAE